MTPNPSFQYLTSSLRIAPFAEVETARGVAFESAKHKPGKRPLWKGLHEWSRSLKISVKKLLRRKGWGLIVTVLFERLIYATTQRC
jgi:hypothetical protein